MSLTACAGQLAFAGGTTVAVLSPGLGQTDADLDLVAVVARAAAQPGSDARELHRLAIHDGRLYVAYGDYGANTGPIHVLSTPLAAPGVFTDEATLDTEETWHLRSTGGRLLVPHVDPRSAPAALSIRDTDGAWRTDLTVSPGLEHAFDVLQTDDGIFLFGSGSVPQSGGGGVVWRSTDDGATWDVSLAPRPETSDYARFYAAWLLGDEVWTTLSTDDAAAKTFRWPPGGPWEDVTEDIAPQFGPAAEAFGFSAASVPFALVLDRGLPEGEVHGSPWRIIARPEQAATGVAAAFPDADLYDAFDTDDHLYLLTATGRVWRGDRTGSWVELMVLDVNLRDQPRSLAVDEDGGFVYVGTRSSAVYRTALPSN